MSNKFEQLLDLLVNEENEKAESLFHEIVVEKSRDIYEGLAETEEDNKESKEEKVEETSEEKVDETSEEKVDETEKASDKEVDEGEEVEIEETSKEDQETNEEESIEEVGGDATDELVKDISAEEEGEMAADEMGDEMDAGDEGDEKDAEDTEERVADLEDALDELKAEFEKMMAGDKDEPEMEPEMDKEESLEPTPEVEMEAKHDDKKKEKMDEYKIQKSADNADHSDKGAKSPVKDAGNKMPKGGDNIAKGSADEKGRPAPTAQKMSGDFENTGGKDKSTSFKKQETANTADGSDKGAKSPVASK
jgi:hypothetical protein